MKDLTPIRMLPTRERVASVLRKAILSRELKEGDELTLDGIAKQLGVSSTPVREAFQILSRDGLIKLRLNKGAQVLGVNKDTIRDHYETRAILESEAAYMVCKKNVDVSGIVDAFEKATEAIENGESKEYSCCNEAFHLAIWDACGNKKIKELLQSLWNGLSMGHQVTEADYANISYVEHKQIISAFINRDADLVKHLMRNHIIRSMDNILTHFENAEE